MMGTLSLPLPTQAPPPLPPPPFSIWHLSPSFEGVDGTRKGCGGEGVLLLLSLCSHPKDCERCKGHREISV